MIQLKKIFWIVLFLLIVLNIGLSAYLIYDQNKIDFLCVAGQSCDFVQNSSYAYLFGIKLIYISIVAFTLLLILFLFANKLFILASFIGAILAVYFISIQLFILKEICSTCFIIDFVMILIFILSLIRYFKFNSKSKKK